MLFVTCRGVLLNWIRVGQEPTALAVVASGGCLDIFSLDYHLFFLSPCLWETARYRLSQRAVKPKQPTNHCRVGSVLSLLFYLLMENHVSK